ncbi:MAG TPA: hypothetical protein PK231_02730 [Acidocella sp.]|jgi:hypothetical protein|nr:MAG: hypothetical protein B7Z77_07725 [Acidocella sp. 20-58-15]HQT38313.1 hypothetical protein [Acidocella sp.]
MTESETEDETLERLERALRRISEIASAPRVDGEAGIDRKAVLKTLDTLIERLRTGLKTPNASNQFSLE